MNKPSPRPVAFFNPRVFFGFMLCVAGAFIALVSFGLFTGSSALAQDREAKAAPAKPQVQSGMSVKNDVSPPLRDLPAWPVRAKEMKREANRNPPIPHKHVDQPDPVVQNAHFSALSRLAPSIPSPIRNFDGIPFPGVGCNCAPPDTVGEVGATQYVQAVNEAVQVFDKTNGNSLLGPISISSVWAGFGGVCEFNGGGDPVVLYDQLADRWLLSQFAGTSNPTTECIAISTTGDATGTWHRYAFFLGSNFFDYPHLAVWPDAYYCAFNVFNASGTAYLGPQAFAFDRTAMLAGNPAGFVTPGITGGPSEETFLPADLDGSTLPPAGAPATFVWWPGGASANTYRVWHFHADFVTPANTTFTQFAAPAAAPFSLPSTVPQLGTTSRLADLGDRLMFRLAYRNFGTHEAVVGNFTVGSGGVNGIRWFELRNVTAGPVTLHQESTYQPDTTWRWMGSVAQDRNGSMALGFSASSDTIFPQIRYAARNAADPLGVLGQGEAHLFDGTGSQVGTGGRWGDYSAMTVDPVDDETFWYTQQYYAVTDDFNWRTRIGSFRLATVPISSIVTAGSAIVSAGANNTLDPGETVTVALGIRDVNAGAPGTVCTSVGLTGTLQSGGGVTGPSAAQNYGSLCTNGPAIFRQFTFTVDPALPCGSTVTATLEVVDGATNYGTIAYQFVLGSTSSAANVENFDGVTAPNLPPGWTTAFTGTGAPVVTSTTFPDTAPNDAFFVDSATVGVSELTSPTIAIANAGTKLSFRNLFNTEAGWDGMVLEISINSGAFQDIITAGGSFVTGGYTSILGSGSNNPLAGRAAWNGLSGGTAAAPAYITSVVTLPPGTAGQNVQFKWRAASDSNTIPATNPGARIDTLTFSSAVCGGSAPVPNSAVSRKVHGGAGTFNLNLPLVPLTGSIGIESRQGSPSGEHQIVVTFPGPVTVGGAAVTAGTGNAATSVASNVVTINLTGVTDRQRLSVMLSSVNDGANLGSVIIPMGVLSGDANGSAAVNTTDIAITKSGAATGAVNGSNFRADVVPNGVINTSDIGLVKARSGNNLP